MGYILSKGVPQRLNTPEVYLDGSYINVDIKTTVFPCKLYEAIGGLGSMGF